MIYGFIGVLIFSLTLPATKLTSGFLDPFFVSMGRAIIAAVFGLVVLLAKNSLAIPLNILPRLALVACGIVFGFPIFTTLALQNLPASHGALVLGILPLATSIAGAILANEKQTSIFWISSVIGSITVTGYTIISSAFRPSIYDLYLVLAVTFAAMGYAEGGILAKKYGGWRIISWALIISSPITASVTLYSLNGRMLNAPLSAWIGFSYTAVFSMFIGFVFWYKGMELSGIGKVGQFQLLQPFLTFIFSAILLSESLDFNNFVVALFVGLCIFVGRLKWKTVFV